MIIILYWHSAMCTVSWQCTLCNVHCAPFTAMYLGNAKIVAMHSVAVGLVSLFFHSVMSVSALLVLQRPLSHFQLQFWRIFFAANLLWCCSFLIYRLEKCLVAKGFQVIFLSSFNPFLFLFLLLLNLPFFLSSFRSFPLSLGLFSQKAWQGPIIVLLPKLSKMRHCSVQSGVS